MSLTPKIGQRVIVKSPGLDPVVGTVVDGPVWKNGKAVFKVEINDPDEGPYAIWCWPERLGPVLREV